MIRDRSLDDVLEDERKGKLTHVVGAQALAEDNKPPDSKVRNAYGGSKLHDDHPTKDTDTDSSEVYEGED